MTAQHLCVPLSERDFIILYINIYSLIKFIKNIMDKKELKFYEAPACEVVELNASVALLAGSAETNPFDGSTQETEEGE